VGPIGDRLLERAAAPGRMRGIGLALWREARSRPSWTGRIFAEGLREARALHSGERRLVQELLYALIRGERRLAWALGDDDPEQLWLAALVVAGLSPEVAAGHYPGPWSSLLARWERCGEDLPLAERVALRHHWSAALAERLAVQLPDELEVFATASDTRAPTDVRANPRRCSAEALAARLSADGVESAPLSVPGGLRIVGRHNLLGSAAFREGWFEVQDQGSQQVAALVEPTGLVIDVCAGAGGKSLAFAAAGAEVLALDVRSTALAALQRRAERAGVRIRTRRIAPEGLPADLPLAERVVVDAPCTGTGTLRRHPERRFVDPEDLERLCGLQRRLLREAATRVAPGGRLVYATCSVLTEEGEDVVRALRDAEPSFTLHTELRTWPHRDGADGFYVAVLTR
jgi:16S rRNA (cytosine967-C5)-methyltransferase